MSPNQSQTNPPLPSLAEPLARVFADRAEADWAFDLFRDTTRRLQATGAYDPRLAVTLSERSGKLHLRLNFGSWLVLGVRGPGQALERVDMALLAREVSWDERFTGFAFERKEGEPEVRTYALPIDVVRPLTSTLQQAYDATLDYIAAKFQSWKKATHWKQHNPEIVEAFFDPDRRERLFATGLTDFELVYERQYTAFGQELALAEEGVDYEVEAKAKDEDEAENGDEGNINAYERISVESEEFNKKLRNVFERFKQNFYDRCIVKLRRKRVAQLRELLSDPNQVDVHIFNKEVWNIHNNVTFSGTVIDIFEREDFSPEALSQIEAAIDSGDFEVGGNSIWGSGSRVYAPRLSDEDEKRKYIGQALLILNDTKLPPLEKAQLIKGIYGFGDNISTGLVMTFHPNEFSLYNREARRILDKLGYGDKNSLEAYQEIVRRLKDDLGAQDFLELDWFLYRINRGAYSDLLTDPKEGIIIDNELVELALPFSQIFLNIEEAQWAFDFLAETCTRLGLDDPDDERFTITLVERYGGLSLHFNFYDWLIVAFRPPELAQKRVRLPLLVDQAPFGKSFIEYEFEQDPVEPPLAAYGVPLDQVQNGSDDFQVVYAETLHHIAHRFETKSPPPRSPHHRPDIAQAVFDQAIRLKLFTEDESAPPNRIENSELRIEKASPPTPQLSIINYQLSITNPPYPLAQLAADTGLPEAELTRWLRAIDRKKQVVLYGPPGTGKTYVAERLARHLIATGDGFTEFVQFHPAYAYEDFMQGLRPQALPDGGLAYPLVPGRFLDFCAQARTKQGICVLIIDEINRANLARVFGELMVLLEYRDKTIPLAGGGQLSVPHNVRLIGTMNTADRSIALVDHALRRRFAFIALHPNFDILRHYHHQYQTTFPIERLITVLSRLNRRIGDPHFEIGITYFLLPQLRDDIEDIWCMEIEPYLDEFFFDQPGSVDEFRWEQVRGEIFRNDE